MQAFDKLPSHPSHKRVEVLYQRYANAVRACCRRILRNGTAAEDAVQETFLRVHRSVDNLPDGESALPWVYRIATNYCLNQLRNQKLHQQARSRMVSFWRSPEDEIGATDCARHLLQRLPERVGAVAWLTHAEGMRQAEVAAMLGISRRTVVNDCQQISKRRSYAGADV